MPPVLREGGSSSKRPQPFWRICVRCVRNLRCESRGGRGEKEREGKRAERGRRENLEGCMPDLTSLTLTSMLCREGSMPYLASLTLACMLLRERNQLLQVVSMGGFNIESGSGKMCCWGLDWSCSQMWGFEGRLGALGCGGIGGNRKTSSVVLLTFPFYHTASFFY